MYSAGILPITIIDGHVHVLLGRESYDKSYSDFGGKYDTNDNTIEQTAYREFTEESMYYGISFTDFKKMSCIYTESRTIKGHIYYMFLVNLDISTINQIISNFNDKQHTINRANVKSQDVRGYRDRDTNHNKVAIRSRDVGCDDIAENESMVMKPHTLYRKFKRGQSNSKYCCYEKDKMQLYSFQQILNSTYDTSQSENINLLFNLRHVFYNTIKMHRTFLNSMCENLQILSADLYISNQGQCNSLKHFATTPQSSTQNILSTEQNISSLYGAKILHISGSDSDSDTQRRSDNLQISSVVACKKMDDRELPMDTEIKTNQWVVARSRKYKRSKCRIGINNSS